MRSHKMSRICQKFWIFGFFFAFSIRISFKLSWWKPHGNMAIGSRDIALRVIAKTIKNEEIVCFFWLYLYINICDFLLILLDCITYIYSHHLHRPINTWWWSTSDTFWLKLSKITIHTKNTRNPEKKWMSIPSVNLSIIFSVMI